MTKTQIVGRLLAEVGKLRLAGKHDAAKELDRIALDIEKDVQA